VLANDVINLICYLMENIIEMLEHLFVKIISDGGAKLQMKLAYSWMLKLKNVLILGKENYRCSYNRQVE